jgi:hypothetical protein
MSNPSDLSSGNSGIEHLKSRMALGGSRGKVAHLEKVCLILHAIILISDTLMSSFFTVALDSPTRASEKISDGRHCFPGVYAK